MRQFGQFRWMITTAGLVFTLSAPLAFSQSDSSGQPADQGNRTGFTDGQSTPSGTNVVTGQEEKQTGAQSGVGHVTRKHKKRSRKAQNEPQGSVDQTNKPNLPQ